MRIGHSELHGGVAIVSGRALEENEARLSRAPRLWFPN